METREEITTIPTRTITTRGTQIAITLDHRISIVEDIENIDFFGPVCIVMISALFYRLYKIVITCRL